MSLAQLIVLGVIVVLLVALTVRFAREWERAVVSRRGRLLPEPKGPGLFLLIPAVDRMKKVDLRTVALDLRQEGITRDHVPVRVHAVAYFRIVEPTAAIAHEDYLGATSQVAERTFRSVLGQHVLDELVCERDKINRILQSHMDDETSQWGVKVPLVEVREVEIPADMKRDRVPQRSRRLYR